MSDVGQTTNAPVVGADLLAETTIADVSGEDDLVFVDFDHVGWKLTLEQGEELAAALDKVTKAMRQRRGGA